MVVNPHIFLVFLTIILFLPFPASSADSSSPESSLLFFNRPPWWQPAQAGNRLWEEGDQAGAVAHWEHAVADGYRDGSALYHLGRYYALKENWKKAIPYLKMALPRMERQTRSREAKISLHETLAAAYRETGRYYESYIHYQKALNLDPESVSLRLGLAGLYYLQDKPDRAELEARTVLKNSPDNPRAALIVARAAEKRGDFPAAAEYYRMVILRQPDNLRARYSLAYITHFYLNDTAAARQELERVIADDPDLPGARSLLAHCYLGSGDFAAARREAEAALRQNKDDPRALIILGELELRDENFEAAEQYYRKARRVDPSGPMGYYGLGVIAFDRREYDRAQQLFQKAVRLSEEFTDAVYNLGLVYQAQGKEEEAFTQFNSIIRDHPDFAPAHLSLGRLYYSSGDREKAAGFFLNALALDRTSWEPYYFLGRYRYDRGDFAAALEYYRPALKMEPDNPALLTDIALAYEKAGETERAEEMLKRALAADPNYLRAFLKLGVMKSRRTDRREADELYQQALVIRPGEINWGYRGERKDFLQDLIAGLEDYLGAGIDYLSLYALLKNISADRNLFVRLIPVLHDKLKSYPRHPQYPHLLGMAYQELGKPEEAEKYYSRSLRLNSDFAAAHLSLGQLYTQRGDYDAARTHLRAVLSLAPGSPVSATVKQLLDRLPE